MSLFLIPTSANYIFTLQQLHQLSTMSLNTCQTGVLVWCSFSSDDDNPSQCYSIGKCGRTDIDGTPGPIKLHKISGGARVFAAWGKRLCCPHRLPPIRSAFGIFMVTTMASV